MLNNDSLEEKPLHPDLDKKRKELAAKYTNPKASKIIASISNEWARWARSQGRENAQHPMRWSYFAEWFEDLAEEEVGTDMLDGSLMLLLSALDEEETYYWAPRVTAIYGRDFHLLPRVVSTVYGYVIIVPVGFLYLLLATAGEIFYLSHAMINTKRKAFAVRYDQAIGRLGWTFEAWLSRNTNRLYHVAREMAFPPFLIWNRTVTFAVGHELFHILWGHFQSKSMIPELSLRLPSTWARELEADIASFSACMCAESSVDYYIGKATSQDQIQQRIQAHGPAYAMGTYSFLALGEILEYIAMYTTGTVNTTHPPLWARIRSFNAHYRSICKQFGLRDIVGRELSSMSRIISIQLTRDFLFREGLLLVDLVKHVQGKQN